MPTTRLFLIRHGQVEGFDTGRINGQADAPLTALGRVQAEAVARKVDHIPFDGVYSSDLQRADFGARCVLKNRDISHEQIAGLRELHFGAWEGCTHQEVEIMEQATMDYLFARLMSHPCPRGESIARMHTRVVPVLEDILLRHAGKDICMVAHSGVNRTILSHALCGSPELFWKLDQGYGCLNIIEFGAHNGPVIRLLNQANPKTGSIADALI